MGGPSAWLAALARRARTPLARLAIAFIGLHSCALGAVMLAAPALMARLFGFGDSVPVFFPSQSGIFLTVLGLCYLTALVEPSFVWTILVSKALAVVFLVVHVAFLSAPRIILGAAAGDAGMLLMMMAAMARAGAPPEPAQEA